MTASGAYRKRACTETVETSESDREAAIPRTATDAAKVSSGRRNRNNGKRRPAVPAVAAVAKSEAAQSVCGPKVWQPENEESASIYDVVADAEGAVRLMPLNGSESRALSEFAEDEPVTIRVFRFFEDKSDQTRIWERELRNVNSGSLLWLVVHMQPKMHSVSGAKYGRWFMAHHVRVLPKSLKSAYFMFEEGSSALAKSFGATPPVRSLVSGEKLKSGYMWFATPDHLGSEASLKDVAGSECLNKFGWQHEGAQGLYSGDELLAQWSKQGSVIDELGLQQLLRQLAPLAQ